MPRPPKSPGPPRGPAPGGPKRFTPGGPRPSTPRPGAPKGLDRPHGPPRPPRPPAPEAPREPSPTRLYATPRAPAPPAAPPEPRGRTPRAVAPSGAVWLYGLHAVAAALRNPNRRVRRLLLTPEAEESLAAAAPKPWAMAPEPTDRPRLDALLGRDIVHQGIALLADILPVPSLTQALERPGPILVLDQVTDPRNVGAILRSAAAFAACCVITQDRHAPDESGAMARAASGALETVPLLRAVNIARTIIALKAADVWCVGLDAAAAPLRGDTLAGRRVALVLGSEDEGLRRLTRETCDEIAALKMPGGMESLNVAAAAAIALYEMTR